MLFNAFLSIFPFIVHIEFVQFISIQFKFHRHHTWISQLYLRCTSCCSVMVYDFYHLIFASTESICATASEKVLARASRYSSSKKKLKKAYTIKSSGGMIRKMEAKHNLHRYKYMYIYGFFSKPFGSIHRVVVVVCVCVSWYCSSLDIQYRFQY